MDHLDGPCPRFGSSYLVLRPELSHRCSFTSLGSQEASAAEETGTLKVPEPWLSSLARHLIIYPIPLGVRGLTLHGLVTQVSHALPLRFQSCLLPTASRSKLDTAPIPNIVPEVSLNVLPQSS